MLERCLRVATLEASAEQAESENDLLAAIAAYEELLALQPPCSPNLREQDAARRALQAPHPPRPSRAPLPPHRSEVRLAFPHPLARRVCPQCRLPNPHPSPSPSPSPKPGAAARERTARAGRVRRCIAPPCAASGSACSGSGAHLQCGALHTFFASIAVQAQVSDKFQTGKSESIIHSQQLICISH